MSDDGQDREAVIRVRGLRNQFGKNVVHEDLDLDVYRGEVLGIVGGSGTGKSVLLRAIVGLLRPVAGSVEVFGRDVLNASDAERAEIEARLRDGFEIDDTSEILDAILGPKEESDG